MFCNRTYCMDNKNVTLYCNTALKYRIYIGFSCTTTWHEETHLLIKLRARALLYLYSNRLAWHVNMSSIVEVHKYPIILAESLFLLWYMWLSNSSTKVWNLYTALLVLSLHIFDEVFRSVGGLKALPQIEMSSSKESSPEESSWVYDSLVGFLAGPVWQVPILTFIENKSLSKHFMKYTH